MKQIMSVTLLLSLLSMLYVDLNSSRMVGIVSSSHILRPSAARKNTSTTSEKMDWMDSERIHNITHCFHVQNICHSAQRWFYDDEEPTSSRGQPPFKIQIKSPAFQSGYPANITVTRRKEIDPDHLLQCSYSPIPNHLVLHTLNSMLGEFYARALVGFVDIVDMHQDHLQDFLTQTQVYLHMEDINKAVLDSHHLFLDSFISNPLLSFKMLLDTAQCRCIKRLDLCGYGIQSAANETYVSKGGHVGPTPYHYGSWDDNGPAPDIFQKLRTRLTQGVERNPVIQQEIKNYRLDLLQNMGIHDRFEEYKIVGLMQRKLRRRWLNMDDVLSKCNDHFRRDKIVCVEINLENEYSNPMTQVIMHAVLDMLIGVHGAGLTEAIWMPKHAIVVELLPWIHPWTKYGSWARVTHQATPLGVIWADTDLNHLGYRLPRESVPLCFNDFSQECFARARFNFQKTDVKVPSGIVKESISKFLKPKRSTMTDCGSWKKQAGGSFVLYNVQCADSRTNQTVSPHRFFRKSMGTAYDT